MAEYNGSIELISGIKPKNNGTFALVNAQDVQVDDTGKRLDARLSELENLESKLGSITLSINNDDGKLYIYINGSPVGGGITLPEGASGDITGNFDSEGKLLLTGNIPDGTYVGYITESGNIVRIGNVDLYCTITNNLTYCTNSNKATIVENGSAYSATITANSGYTLKTVTVTMGGSAVSVSGGTINIPKVSGDIVITAEATAQQLENYVETVGYVQGRIRSSNGELDNSALYVEYEAMNYIPIEYGDKITIENIVLENSGSCSMAVYDSNKTFIKGGYMYAFVNGGLNGERSSGIISSLDGITATSGVAYIRFSAKEITANSIVTVEKN